MKEKINKILEETDALRNDLFDLFLSVQDIKKLITLSMPYDDLKKEVEKIREQEEEFVRGKPSLHTLLKKVEDLKEKKNEVGNKDKLDNIFHFLHDIDDLFTDICLFRSNIIRGLPYEKYREQAINLGNRFREMSDKLESIQEK